MKAFLTLAPFFVAATALGQFVLIQDFETDISGVQPVYAPAEIQNTKLFRVDNTPSSGISGFLPGNSNPGSIPGANSSLNAGRAQGTSGYLEIDTIAYFQGPPTSASYSQGPRAQWNILDPVANANDPFVSGAGHRAAVYLDDPTSIDSFFNTTVYPVNSGFFWQPGLTEAGSTTRIEAGGFGFRVINTGSGPRWVAQPDGIGRGYDSTSAFPTYGFDDANDTQAGIGWYNLETVWLADFVNGTVDEINRIYTDNFSSMVFEYSRQDIANLSDVGGLGNVSIGNGSDEGGIGTIVSQMPLIGVDEVGIIIPEPNASLIILLSASLFLTRQRKFFLL